MRGLLREIIYTRDKDMQLIYCNKAYLWFKEKLLNKPKKTIIKMPTEDELINKQKVINDKADKIKNKEPPKRPSVK